MSRMTPQSLDQLLTTMRQDIDALKRRQVIVPSSTPVLEGLAVNGPTTLEGLSASSISQNGHAVLDIQSLALFGMVTADDSSGAGYTVAMDNGATLTGVRYLAKSPAVVGQRVGVVPDGLGGWLILGRRSLLKQKLISTLTGGHSYGSGFAEPYGYLTGDGIAVLQGLMVPSTSAVTAGTTMFTLPSWLCPDIPSTQYLAFSVSVSDTIGMILIYGNGAVVPATNIGASQYISFSGIAYPTTAAGFSWTNVAAQGTAGVPAFANGWTSRAAVAPAAVVPRWALDNYGCMWVQGQVGNASVPTTNTAIITFPGGLTPASQMIYQVVGNNGLFGMVFVDNGTSGHLPAGIDYNSASAMAAGGYHDLGSLCIPMAGSSLRWNVYTTPNTNGWSTYGAINTTPMFAIRRDLVLMQGLIASGTVGSTFNAVPTVAAPMQGPNGSSAVLLQNRPSNGARGRLDIWANGSILPTQGSSTWFSLDGFTYVAE